MPNIVKKLESFHSKDLFIYMLNNGEKLFMK